MSSFLSILTALLMFCNMVLAAPAKNVSKTAVKHVIKSVTLDVTADTEEEEDTHEVYELEYDEKGRLSSVDSKAYSGFEKYLYPDMVYTVIIPGIDTYEYNSDNQVSKITRSDEDGDVRFTVEYEYEDGKVSQETYDNGNKTIVSTYFYNDDETLEYVERDEGIRVSTLKYSFNEDGTLDHSRLKETINGSYFDYTTTVSYLEDGRIQSVQMMSANTIDESTGINFTYNDDGDLYQVIFTQGYFKNEYCFTYEYGDIVVKG